MKKNSIYIILLSICMLGCEEILFEEDLSNDTITIVAPTSGALVENTSVVFSWNQLEGATSYHLQVARPNFENATQILEDTTVTMQSYNATLIRGNYEWRVRGQNAGSETPFVTTPFEIVESDDFSSREVILDAPANDAIVNNTSVTLQWQAVTDASLYRVQVINENQEVIEEQTTANTSIQLIFPEGVSRWQIRAENNTQSTLYGDRSLTVDSTNPAKPVNTTPADESILNDTTISFSWTREVVEGTTEIDSVYIFRNEQLTDLFDKDMATSPTEIEVDAGTTYYWFIRAFDQAGNQGESSDVFSFTVN